MARQFGEGRGGAAAFEVAGQVVVRASAVGRIGQLLEHGEGAALRRAGVRVTVVRPSDRESVLGRGVDMLDPYRAAASLRQGEWDAATVGQPPR